MFKLLVASLATASALQLKRQPAAKPLSNALKLRGGLDLTDLDTAGLFGAMYYGGFGVTLLANPEFFYGADGLVPYFKASPGPVGTFFGRTFGACMTGMAALNFLDGADKATMLKAMAIGGACMLPQMVSNANDDVNFMTVIWKAQIVVHIATTYVLAKAGGLL